MKNYGDYLDKVKTLVKDINGAFDDDPYPGALDEAVFQYSHDEPRKVMQSYTAGQSGAFIGEDRTFPMPTYWDDDISVRSFRIESPVDLEALQDTILDIEQVMVYLGVNGNVLRLRAEQWIDQPIAAGEVFYLRYYGLHVVTSGQVTVSDSRFYAVCDLAASKLCKLMATRTAGLGSMNIGGGQANYTSQSSSWLKMQDVYYKQYCSVVKPDEGDEKPSGLFITSVTNPLHEIPHGLWPRDNDGRKNLIN